MSKTIKYIGTQDRWPELQVTGKQSNWRPGQQEDRSDAEAALLMATGLFSGVPLTVRADSVTGAITTASGQSLSVSPVIISGGLGVGLTLTAAPAAGYSFTTGQWYRAGVAINGATALAYQQQAADIGKELAFVPAGMSFYRAVAGTVPGDASIPTTLTVKQSIRVVDQTPVARVLHRSSPRDSVIVRNTGATTLQVGATTNGNNNNNAPSTWEDVAPGNEFYEGDVDHQLWVRAKTAGETVTAQIEVATPRI